MNKMNCYPSENKKLYNDIEYIIMLSICSKVLNANNNIMKAKSNREKGENSNAEK